MSGKIYTNRFTAGASALGSKALLVESIWQQPGNNHDLTRAAYCACVTPMSPIDKLFTVKFGDTVARGSAIKYFRETAISGAAWHHGDQYALSLKGNVATILEHCSVSQTEREQLLIEAARRSTHGREAVAIATGIMSTLPYALAQARSLDFVGLVLIKPVMA